MEASMTTIEPLHLPSLTRRITLHMVITGKRQFAVRLWIGRKLLILAGAVIGCGLEILDKRDC
jgi:hypothetical protein